MRRATARVVQAGIALALLASLVPLSVASAADDEASARPLHLMSVEGQQPPGPSAGAAPVVPPVHGVVRAPVPPVGHVPSSVRSAAPSSPSTGEGRGRSVRAGLGVDHGP